MVDTQVDNTASNAAVDEAQDNATLDDIISEVEGAGDADIDDDNEDL
jgi:hypothetical protein